LADHRLQKLKRWMSGDYPLITPDGEWAMIERRWLTGDYWLAIPRGLPERLTSSKFYAHRVRDGAEFELVSHRSARIASFWLNDDFYTNRFGADPKFFDVSSHPEIRFQFSTDMNRYSLPNFLEARKRVEPTRFFFHTRGHLRKSEPRAIELLPSGETRQVFFPDHATDLWSWCDVSPDGRLALFGSATPQGSKQNPLILDLVEIDTAKALWSIKMRERLGAGRGEELELRALDIRSGWFAPSSRYMALRAIHESADDVEDQTQVLVIDLAERSVSVVQDLPPVIHRPSAAFRPDGRKLVLVSAESWKHAGGVWSVDLGSSRATKLPVKAPPSSCCVWWLRNDRLLIAQHFGRVSGYKRERPRIWSVNLDGTDERMIFPPERWLNRRDAGSAENGNSNDERRRPAVAE